MSKLNTVLSGIAALANPGPYAYANLLSQILTGKSLLGNVPGPIGSTVSGIGGSVGSILPGAGGTPGGGITSLPIRGGSPMFPGGSPTAPVVPSVISGGGGPKPFVPGPTDFGGPRAYGVGSEQQRRQEALEMFRNLIR